MPDCIRLLTVVPDGYFARHARQRCQDCQVREGEDHAPGCGQVVCASCLKGVDVDDDPCECATPLPAPFFYTPPLCMRCGALWPEMYMADEWPKVIPEVYQEELLCLECYAEVK